MSNKIQQAIRSVQADEAAEARMYEHILTKSKQAPRAGRVTRIARIALPAAACLVLVFALAARPWERPARPEDRPGRSDRPVMVVNPYVTVEGPEAFEPLGLQLEAPAGSTDVQYQIRDNDTAVVSFTLDGKEYQALASKQEGEFCGVYGDREEVWQEGNAVLAKISGVWKLEIEGESQRVRVVNHGTARQSDLEALAACFR